MSIVLIVMVFVVGFVVIFIFDELIRHEVRKKCITCNGIPACFAVKDDYDSMCYEHSSIRRRISTLERKVLDV